MRGARGSSVRPLFGILLSGALLFAAGCATPLASAAKRGDAAAVEQLAASGADLDARDSGGNTALHLAAQRGHTEVVRVLLARGADPDADNDFGSTPLHMAARYGHTEVIRLLVEAGADVNARNLSGGASSRVDAVGGQALADQMARSATPLVRAARTGQLEAVETLIELGAELPAPDAVQEAQRRGHPEVAAVIVRAAAEGTRRPAGGAIDVTGGVLEITPAYGRRLAAVIGISRYQRMTRLEGAERDARDVAELLRTLGFDAVYELYDAEATRGAILDLVGERLRRESRPDDLVFVFFAGHGATEELGSGEKRGYVLPVEGSALDPYVSGISMETIRDLSNRLAARHVYYAVDACYSGGLIASDEGTRGRADGQSVQVLTAGLEGQQALERDGRGLFTSYLLQGLRGEANVDGDGVVTASEIGWFVSSQVGQASDGKQTPAYGRLGGTGEVSFPVRE